MTDEQAAHQAVLQGQYQQQEEGADAWRLLGGRAFVSNPDPVGCGSIHFDGDAPYCLYTKEALPAGMQLANGDEIPEKVYLQEPKWDPITNTFSGHIDWSENPFDTGVTQISKTLYKI